MKIIMVFFLTAAVSCNGISNHMEEKAKVTDAMNEINEASPRETDVKDRQVLKMSDDVYQRLQKGWKDQGEYNSDLSRKLIQSLSALQNFKAFTIEQVWDLCSTFEYAIVVAQDSNTASPFISQHVDILKEEILLEPDCNFEYALFEIKYHINEVV